MSEQKLAAIHARIAAAAALAGRKPEDVALIAVSKTREPPEIEPLLAAGQRVFGENRVQEAQAKWPGLREAYSDVRLHLVGQLQSNKAADAVALFDAIHSVDRSSLVTALARAMEGGRRPDCFVQVNIGDEPQKGGCAVAGLPYFALLAKLARDHGLPGLSMGMSDDLETAVMIGATHVRVGTALFGARA
jgi:uncharacterized pyridoxal phosphate-containing UPF0001 family protein